jgi:hypothetical protein
MPKLPNVLSLHAFLAKNTHKRPLLPVVQDKTAPTIRPRVSLASTEVKCPYIPGGSKEMKEKKKAAKRGTT